MSKPYRQIRDQSHTKTYFVASKSSPSLTSGVPVAARDGWLAIRVIEERFAAILITVLLAWHAFVMAFTAGAYGDLLLADA